MKQKARNLGKLGQIADVILNQELADLARISEERDALQGEIMNLETALRTLAEKRGSSESSGAWNLPVYDRNWQSWRRQKRKELNSALAKTEAARQAKLALARKAFGRTQAITALIRKA